MERIKAALERARQEQSKQPAEIALVVTPAADSIVYQQTRTVKLSPRRLRNARAITALDNSAVTDAYRILRTQVLQRMEENHWNTLAITSPGHGEGKTLTAINLAISLAMEVNYTVLLVDADLRHPSIHEALGIPVTAGLSDYLTGNIPLSEILIHPEGLDRLVVLPGNNSLFNSSEMLNSPKMSQLVEEMKNRYPSRMVLFDLPPVLSASDALSFSPYVDAALLVLEEGKTKAPDITRAMELLQGTQVVGTVLNRAEIPDTGKNARQKTGGWISRLFKDGS
jgi:exopolysaccharide/PEP-CTERM locus tyrosine autokinase